MRGRPRRSYRSCGSERWLLLAAVTVALGLGGAAGLGSAGRAVFGGAATAWAQSPPPAPPSLRGSQPPAKTPGQTTKTSAGRQEQEQDRVVVEHADRLRREGAGLPYILEGRVRIRHKDAVLTCDWAQYDEDKDEALARGHLLLQDPETTVTGDVMRVNFTEEVAEVEGNVVIVTQKKKKAEETGAGGGGAPSTSSGPAGGPQQGQGQAAGPQAKPASHSPTEQPQNSQEEKEPRTIREYRERKTTIYCPRLRYRYTEGQRYAWVAGPIRAEQTDRQAWADKAEYDAEEGILKLSGNVRVKTKDGDEFQCPAVVISVDEEWLRAESVSGVALRKKKKSEQPAQPPPPEGGGPASPPPGPPAPSG
jgi:lipopolysaccharide export system protein LptA